MTDGSARWAEGIAEAAWLAALVVTPLYVEVSAEHPFEPTKAAAVRILAVVAAVAFGVGAIDRLRTGAVPARAARGSDRALAAWLAAVGALAVVQTASALASLAPATSLFGGIQRSQGLTTLLAYLIIGVVAAASIRRREQVTRALTCSIVAAVPVAIAAIAEHHGWMLLPRETPPPRAASTLGNPMALGGYLVFVVPLAVARLADATRALDLELHRARWRRAAATGGVLIGAFGWILGGPVFGAVLAAITVAAGWSAMGGRSREAGARVGLEIAVVGLLLGALVVTGSRGAAVGAAVGAILAAVVVWPRGSDWSARRLTVVAAGAVAVAMAAAVVVRLVGGRIPLLDRISEPLDGPGSTVAVRTTLWRTAVDVLGSDTPLRTASAIDGAHWLRPILGHGPETTELALGPFAPAELWQQEGGAAVPDRVHGALLESALQTGILGVIAQLAVFTIAVVAGVGALGRRDSNAATVTGSLLGGGGLGMALALVVDRPELAGIALLVGMIGGLLLHLAFHPPQTAEPVGPNGPNGGHSAVPRVVVVAALAGVLGHGIEVQFAFGWVATSTYAWFALALLIAAGRPAQPDTRLVLDHAGDRWATGAFAGLALALVVHGLGHGDRTALAWVVVVVLAAFVALLRLHAGQPMRRSSSWSPVVAFAVTGAALIAVGRLAVGDGLVRFTPPVGWLAIVLTALLLVVVLAVGVELAPPATAPRTSWRVRGGFTLTVVGLFAAAAIWSLGVTPIRAELMRRHAHALTDPVVAIELFERAQRSEPAGHRAAPTGVVLYLRAAQAGDVTETEARELVRSGIALTETARSHSPFDAEHALVLSELYELLSDLVATEAERVALLDAAVERQRGAVELRPMAAHLRADLAALLFRLSELEAASDVRHRAMAEVELRRATQLDPDLALVPSVRARFAPTWSMATSSAVLALDRLTESGPPVAAVDRRARRLALDALVRADSMATDERAGEHFVTVLRQAATSAGSPDLYLALAEAHGRRGETDDGLLAIRTALALGSPNGDPVRAEYRRVEAFLAGTGGELPVIDLRRD